MCYNATVKKQTVAGATVFILSDIVFIKNSVAELKNQMKDAKIKSWFTSNGSHIPVTEGQTKAEALREKKRQKIENLERIYNSDLVSGVKSDVQKIPQAVGFNRSKTKHHQRHAAEMGLNEREYIQQSISFFNGNEGQVYFSERRERFYKYNQKSMEFVAVSQNGVVHTYRLVSPKEFEKIKRQDKLHE